MEPLPPASVQTVGRKVFFQLSNGTSLDATKLPAWGQPFVCRVLELSPDGLSWKQVVEKPTKDEAGETPGISVVDDFKDESGVSNEEIEESYSCLSGRCRGEVSMELAARASSISRKALAADDLSLWRIQEGLHFLLFNILTGDTAHITNPVFLVSSDSAQISLVPTNGVKQIGLGVKKPFLLVVEEMTGSHPRIIDLRSGNVVFEAPEGFAATWAPDPFE